MFLKDAPVKIGGWASGSYEGVCHACDQQFIGDKRAIFCLPCAHAAAIQAEREACAQIADERVGGNVFERGAALRIAQAIRARS